MWNSGDGQKVVSISDYDERYSLGMRMHAYSRAAKGASGDLLQGTDVRGALPSAGRPRVTKPAAREAPHGARGVPCAEGHSSSVSI